MEIVIVLVAFIAGAVAASFYWMKKNAQLQIDTQSWQTKYELTMTAQAQSKAEQERSEANLTLQFKDLAQKILDEKILKFDQATSKSSDTSLKQLEGLLNPLKEKIKDFEKRVEDSYSTERLERNSLKSELNRLLDLNQTMSKEAQNLTLALKGENKTQGNWGELILENILERSGLRKGEEYFTQETIYNVDGKMQRPDVIVKLPEGKHLIVDSKMTLLAYEASVSAETEEERLRFAMAHVDSLKRHVDNLSSQKYHLAEQVISPDFVMLFMPLEPAFALAFRMKPELFEHAWDKNIAIVSPTTLLSTLRTVSALWKQERQQQNALEIAKRGGELYDKFAGLVKDLETLGERIKSVQKSHDDVMIKVSGRGNLITQVEHLKKLGAKAEKSLPAPTED
jgi:DNA recombination protein RmuC